MRARSTEIRALVVLGLLALATSGCAWVQRASVDSAGNQGNADSGSVDVNAASSTPALSGDGRYVAFGSVASNLVAGDTNGTSDVFVRDTRAGTTTRVSVDSAGSQSNGYSYEPAVSADGQYVAFASGASNLVAGDTNAKSDVFLRDTVTGTTSRVSLTNGGNQANDDGYEPAVSADGRYVAFGSVASNIVAGDTNAKSDVFLRDTVGGGTTRVSVDSAGNEANDFSGGSAISADGHSIAFASKASNLVAGDTNAKQDVFLRDTVAGATTRVSVDGAGNEANDVSDVYGRLAISADGHSVAFDSWASNLVPADTNHYADVFVRNTVAGTTTQASITSAGNQVGEQTETPAISGDGRYVAFVSEYAPLVPADTNQGPDVYVRDLVGATTAQVSVDVSGKQPDQLSRFPAMSADGRYIAFDTLASNLVSGDTNHHVDVIVRANPQPQVTGVTPSSLSRGASTPVTITGSRFVPGALVVVDGPGTSVSAATVVSGTQITATVTVDAGAPLTARNVWVELPGTGPGVGAGAVGACPACVTVT